MCFDLWGWSANRSTKDDPDSLQSILWKYKHPHPMILSEANIYQEHVDSFLLITILNFIGLNSTLPRSASQVLPIFAGRGNACILQGGRGAHPCDLPPDLLPIHLTYPTT